MTFFRVAAVSLCIMLTASCTVTPSRNQTGAQSGGPARGVGNSTASDGKFFVAKAQTVATASIGVPQVYVDQQLGTSTQLIVQSEYFSANGRTCRRYSEIANGKSVSGVSCQDAVLGWIDIPLSSFVR